MENLAYIKELIEIAHNPELAKNPDMVYQIWEDCEITLQKSGRLLWQRTLHSIIPGIPSINVPMPEKLDEHSYAFVTKEDAFTIRKEITKLYGIKDIFQEMLI